jgi:BASS family bile acid:Na+ symporter
MLALPRSLLAFIGRHSAAAFGLSIFLGLALPQLAAALRPFIPISIFCFIVLSFARANMAGIRLVWSRPGRLGIALLWSTLVPPAIGFLAIQALGGALLDPGIRLAIALMAAAPPLMASPVFAAVLGFENSLALSILVLGMIATPLTAPAFASILAGAHVPLEPLELAIRLAVFIGGGILVGIAVRHVVGTVRLSSAKHELDGFNVVLFFLFAIAAMDGVIVATLEDPAMIAGFFVLSTLLAAIGFFASYLAMRPFGFNDQFSYSIGIGLRNMGLLIAPIISLVPKTTFLYFAIAQVPIYLAPILLKAVKHRLERARGTGADP